MLEDTPGEDDASSYKCCNGIVHVKVRTKFMVKSLSLYFACCFVILSSKRARIKVLGMKSCTFHSENLSENSLSYLFLILSSFESAVLIINEKGRKHSKLQK